MSKRYDVDEVNIYDKEELHTDCTVQILRNSITGQWSFGWWPNKEPKHGRWMSAEADPPKEDDVYIVLWKAKEPEYPSDKKLYYETCGYLNGQWLTEMDIPQADVCGGAEVVFWMFLPEMPEVM